MKKADNFDASKWLVENKITFQSRLNEEEYSSERINQRDVEIAGGEVINHTFDTIDMIDLGNGYKVKVLTTYYFRDPGVKGYSDSTSEENPMISGVKTTLIDTSGKPIRNHNFTGSGQWWMLTSGKKYFMPQIKAWWEEKMGKLGLEESRLNEELKNIASELESAGFSFDDGILGGVGSGGGGYYDFISDKINGYDIDEFNEDEFNKWYDSFSLDSFNSSDYDNEMMDDYEIDRNKISQIPPGFYNVGARGLGGFAQVKDNGDVILYANPTLSDMDGEEYYPIFSVDTTGNIVKNMSKEKVATYLKQNLENPGSWAII